MCHEEPSDHETQPPRSSSPSEDTTETDLLKRAKTAYDSGDLKTALDLYESLVEIDPNNPSYWFQRALIKNNGGLYASHQEMIECFDKVLELDETFEEAWVNKGSFLAAANNYVDALKCFDRALDINPDNVLCWYNKGIAYEDHQTLDKALDCYDEILRIDEDNMMANIRKGVIFINVNQPRDALPYFDRVLSSNPDNVLALVNKGEILSSRGDYIDAIELFDRALSQEPENVNALTNKGIALRFLEEFKKALDVFEGALDLVKRIQPARQDLIQLIRMAKEETSQHLDEDTNAQQDTSDNKEK